MKLALVELEPAHGVLTPLTLKGLLERPHAPERRLPAQQLAFLVTRQNRSIDHLRFKAGIGLMLVLHLPSEFYKHPGLRALAPLQLRRVHQLPTMLTSHDLLATGSVFFRIQLRYNALFSPFWLVFNQRLHSQLKYPLNQFIHALT